MGGGGADLATSIKRPIESPVLAHRIFLKVRVSILSRIFHYSQARGDIGLHHRRVTRLGMGLWWVIVSCSLLFVVVCHLLEGRYLSIVSWTMWTLRDLPRTLDQVTSGSNGPFEGLN